jgi:hypothetical protein
MIFFADISDDSVPHFRSSRSRGGSENALDRKNGVALICYFGFMIATGGPSSSLALGAV